MCAIFGLMDYKNVLKKEEREEIIKVLSQECMERGTHATGISYIQNGEITIYKRPKKASKMRFKLPLNANVIMGHTRYTTKGSEKQNYNNHPFYGKTGSMEFAFAHNGVLHNDEILRHTEKLPKTQIVTDSYVAVQLIEKEKVLNLDTLRYMAEKVEGSFCFTLLDKESNLYIVKGDNPISMIKFKKGFYVYASTSDILFRALLQIKGLNFDFEVIDIKDGDIIQITSDGTILKSYFDMYTSYYSTYRPYPFNYYFEYDEEEFAEVKSVANLFGYCEEDIDLLIEDGFSPEEIENYFYERTF